MTATMSTTALSRPARASRAPVRYTRRGRFVIVLLVLVTAFAVFSLGRWGADANASFADDEPTTFSVIVEPGQSLWQIASEVRPDDDPRDTIALLERVNPDLEGGIVLPGQEIVVPR